jgi:predicted MFS family arabinose efflux permease
MIGGYLTDKIGFYKVITLSLFFGGLGFIALQFLDSFYGICLGIFTLILIADSYRPAIFVACDAYSESKMITRSIGLIRLAINLGFSIGPLIGGIIIARISYSSLFWIDGISCMIAAALLFVLLTPKRTAGKEKTEFKVKEGLAPYRNGYYMLLIIILITSGSMFVQYFSVVPLYYEKAHFLTEDLIGWLLFLNGIIIVIFEMPLIAWLERLEISKTMATFWGTFFLMLSFLVLNITSWSGILVLAMILMTLGEMIGSPFSNSLALQMAPKGRKGAYMGMYSMSFSFSHIIGHNSGMNLVDRFGFDNTWYLVSVALLFICLLTLWLLQLLKKSPKFETY